MNSLPLFSVLIANYNNGKYLSEAIESVRKQTYTNWEIIIVDDFSTDNSKDIYQLYAEDNRIKIFYSKENNGCGYTKRRCVELALGDLCGFLDPDDALLPDALSSMVEAHQKEQEASLVYSTYIYCDEFLNEIRINKNPREIPNDTDYLHFNKGSVHAFASFKRALYLKTSGIGSNFKRAIDQDLYYKLEEAGNLFFLDRPLYLYRFHEGGISVNNNVYKALFWHIKAIEDACIRRGIQNEAETIVSDLISNSIANPKIEIQELKNKLNSYIKPNFKTVLKCLYRWIRH